jgi:glycosyltransferase involved in cell wall biosynthesis
VHRPPDHAHSVLAENRRRYDRLVEVVRRHADRGDAERVLRSATVAATYGWLAPMGLLSDPALEGLVVRAVRGDTRPTVDGGRNAGRVLHVLSEAYGTGGHTRLAWRWMTRDPRVSDVALTNHRGAIPEPLVEATRDQGAQLYDLGRTHPDLLSRAVALRALMDRADLVVLHVHPNDAVALAAVNLPGPRPPVIYENHADHAFWLGLGAADLVCDLRPAASRLSTALRGFAAERVGVLPLPLETPPSSSTAAELRARLGIQPDAVVAVTVSAEHKVAATWGRGMDQLLDRALAWSPRLTVVLAGPPPTGTWARLTKRYPKRVFAVGPVSDPGPYYAMADIYLDSYPTRAVTSVLEAALLGLPVLTIEDIPEDAHAHIFQADSPGMVGLPRVHTREQYAVALRRLVDEPELRAREGAAARASVRQAHDGDTWLTAMERLYAQARSLPACDIDQAPPAVEDAEYGAFLLGYTPAQTQSPEPSMAAGPLGELFDEGLQADLFAAFHRDLGPSLTVRAATGWERQTAWTTRLLELAGTHSRLAVSFPFAAGDDAQGTRSAAGLAVLLDGIGQTPESCGDISVDSVVPRQAVPRVAGELPFVPEALDWLEGLLSSPCWEAPTSPARGEGPGAHPAPRPDDASAEHPVPAAQELSSVLP